LWVTKRNRGAKSIRGVWPGLRGQKIIPDALEGRDWKNAHQTKQKKQQKKNEHKKKERETADEKIKTVKEGKEERGSKTAFGGGVLPRNSFGGRKKMITVQSGLVLEGKVKRWGKNKKKITPKHGCAKHFPKVSGNKKKKKKKSIDEGREWKKKKKNKRGEGKIKPRGSSLEAPI